MKTPYIELGDWEYDAMSVDVIILNQKPYPTAKLLSMRLLRLGKVFLPGRLLHCPEVSRISTTLQISTVGILVLYTPQSPKGPSTIEPV